MLLPYVFFCRPHGPPFHPFHTSNPYASYYDSSISNLSILNQLHLWWYTYTPSHMATDAVQFLKLFLDSLRLCRRSLKFRPHGPCPFHPQDLPSTESTRTDSISKPRPAFRGILGPVHAFFIRNENFVHPPFDNIIARQTDLEYCRLSKEKPRYNDFWHFRGKIYTEIMYFMCSKNPIS